MDDPADSVFAEAAEELGRQAPCEFFRVKSRRLGAIVDATTLRRRGWKLVPQDATGAPSPFLHCLWWTKSVRAPGMAAPVEACLGTSGFVVPRKENPRVFRDVAGRAARRLAEGEGIARVFLRRVFFDGVADDGLTFRIPDDNDVPEAAVRAVDDDLAECEIHAPDDLLQDLDYQLAASVDPPPADFAEKSGLLDALTAEADNEGHGASVERLLVRWVRAAIDPEWSPDTAEAFQALGDGWLVWNLVARWERHGNDRVALGRLAAWALEKRDTLERPFTAIAWRGLARILRNAGCRRASLFAQERAVAAEDAEPSDADRLWEWMREHWRGCPDNDFFFRPDMGWFIQMLYRHEDFVSREGYRTLLALALAFHENAGSLAADTALQGLGAELAESVGNPVLPNVRNPCGWQAAMSILHGDSRACLRALSRFPEPLLAAPDDPFEPPREVLSGFPARDYLVPLTPQGHEEKAWTVWNPPRWRDRCYQVGPGPDGVCRLAPAEAACTPGGIGLLTRGFVYAGRSAALRMLLVQVLPDRSSKKLPNAIYEQYVPVPSPMGVMSVFRDRPICREARVWKLYPYCSGVLGEVEFSIDESMFAAVAPFFYQQRDSFVRGQPLEAELYAVASWLRLEPSWSRSRHPPEDFEAAAVLDDCHAVRTFLGTVRHVSETNVAGTGKALRLEIEVGGTLGLLTMFIHPSRVESERPLAEGDRVRGEFMLYATFFGIGKEEADRWRAEHPQGEVPPEPPPHFPPPVGLLRREGVSDKAWRAAVRKWERPDRLALETVDGFDFSRLAVLAEIALAHKFNTSAVVCQPFNPRGIDVSVGNPDGNGDRHYRVFLATDDERLDLSLPPGIEAAVIRVRDAGAALLVEYEGALAGA